MKTSNFNFSLNEQLELVLRLKAQLGLSDGGLFVVQYNNILTALEDEELKELIKAINKIFPSTEISKNELNPILERIVLKNRSLYSFGLDVVVNNSYICPVYLFELVEPIGSPIIIKEFRKRLGALALKALGFRKYFKAVREIEKLKAKIRNEKHLICSCPNLSISPTFLEGGRLH